MRWVGHESPTRPTPGVFRLLVCATALAAGIPGGAHAQAPDSRGSVGLFVALDAGWQNIIGGALVSGMDVLAQARRPVVTLSVGVRVETSFGLVAGVDLGVGVMRGNLRYDDPSGPLAVAYRNRTQRHWNLMVGQALGRGRETNVHLYLSEVSRAFGVDVEDRGETYRQRDEQGLLRYGLGLEREISRHFAARVRVGTSRADFGDQATNMTPRRVLDVMVGGVIHP